MGEGVSFSIAFNRALEDTKLRDKLGRYNRAAPKPKELVPICSVASETAREFATCMEHEYPDIEWFFEADYRIKQDFTEVGHPYNKTMVRSAKTWFTGAMDIVGISKDTGDVLICDYKYYQKEASDIHADQLKCYNTLVGSVLKDRGFVNISRIRNFVVFLKQGTYHELESMYDPNDLEGHQQWLQDYVDEGKAAAEQADVNTPIPSDSNCLYCNYKRKCGAYKRHHGE